MRQLAAVLFLFLATNAWAFRGRPVSDWSFDGRILASHDAVASDGTDFLVLTSTREEHSFAQRIVDGRAVGPQRQVGPGGAAGLVWTGSSYLAAWRASVGLWVGPVSRDGTPLSAPTEKVVHGLSGFLAAKETSVLAFGYLDDVLIAQPLDPAGRPSGPSFTHHVPETTSNLVTVAAAADGFAVVFSGRTGTWLMLFHEDGSKITDTAILLDGPHERPLAAYSSNMSAVATDGTDTLIVFGSGQNGSDAKLTSVVVAADGTIESRHVIHTVPGGGRNGIVPHGLVWVGSQYIAAIDVNKSGARESDIDPALLRIARDGRQEGELAWLAERPGTQTLGQLGWNGRELLVTMTDIAHAPNPQLLSVTANPSTLQPGTTSVLGGTLPEQDPLTIAAGQNGYLAAWFDRSDGVRSVRASRIDAAGNYLDGEGILLDTVAGDAKGTIAIDGNGPLWLVVWSTRTEVRGRFVSRGGRPGAAPIAIGPGLAADVRWDGSQFVVLRSDNSLHRDRVSLAGAVSDTKILAKSKQIDEPGGWRSVNFLDPGLARLAGHTIAVYAKRDAFCTFSSTLPCPAEVTILGLRVDAIDPEPFVISQEGWSDTQITESPEGALVTWRRGEQYAAFLPSESPENSGTPFLLDAEGGSPSFAFDGREFIGAWEHRAGEDRTIATARFGADGTFTHDAVMRLDRGEHAYTPAVAASATLPAIVGFVHRHHESDGVTRGALLFAHEIGGTPPPPPSPSIVSATKNIDGTITVRWQPASNVFGISIELQLSDGTFRPIAVASARATSACVSLAGLEDTAVRVRTWNAGGLSAPSAVAPIVNGKRRAARR